MDINLIHQPTGNTCGPTCIKMAIEYIKEKNGIYGHTPSISDITTLCGTDWIVGTPPEKMEKGMKAIGLKYIEYIHSPRPYDLLNQIIKDENVPILRTITDKIPHWIIVKNILPTASSFEVVDPWKGEIVYTLKQLDSIWKIRNYQCFEIIS